LCRDLARANSLLYRQSTTLRTRAVVERFERFERARADGPDALRRWHGAFPEDPAFDGRHLALVPTVFDRLDPGLRRALAHRGWWLGGAALAAPVDDGGAAVTRPRTRGQKVTASLPRVGA
jgi:NTE family protein